MLYNKIIVIECTILIVHENFIHVSRTWVT